MTKDHDVISLLQLQDSRVWALKRTDYARSALSRDVPSFDSMPLLYSDENIATCGSCPRVVPLELPTHSPYLHCRSSKLSVLASVTYRYIPGAT